MDNHVKALPEKLKAISQSEEFTDVFSKRSDDMKHHEESVAFQKKFFTDVKNVISEIKKRGNPFLPENGPRLKSLSQTGDIMDDDQATILCNAQEIGRREHHRFVEDRIEKCVKPLTDIIERNKFHRFSNHLTLKNKSINKVKEVKMDNKLTNRLLLSLRGRPEAEMGDFFKYESRKCPPTLADD